MDSLQYRHIGVFDYVILALMFSISVAVGIYHGFRRKKGMSTNEYMMGSRNMKVFPIAMSLIATYTSSLTILSGPTLVYLFGSGYAFYCVGMTMTIITSMYTVIPVLYHLKLTSCYEYFKLRFDNKVRLLGSALFILRQISWQMGILHVSALAFNQVSGTPTHITIFVMSLVCICYTCWGGFRGVVWTDVVQIMFVYAALLAAGVKGTTMVGGLSEVWRIGVEGDRISFPSFDLDMTIRQTMWSVTVGVFFLKFDFVVANQNQMNRYFALPTFSAVKWANIIYMGGVIILEWLAVYMGYVAYAIFHDCDPVKSGVAKANDQLVPLLIEKTLMDTPGICGLFLAGVLGAGLSSISTSLNSVSCLVLEDYVKPICSESLSEQKEMIVLYSAVIIFGVVPTTFALFAGNIAALYELMLSLASLSAGAALGINISGLFLPFINAKGALYGGIAGLITNIILVIFAKQKPTFKETSIAGCGNTTNIYQSVRENVSTVASTSDADSTFVLFRVSYLWYSLIGTIVTLSFASVISWLTKADAIQKDVVLFAPILQKKLKKQRRRLEEAEGTELLTKNSQQSGR